jgi:hypothetical protein
VKGVGRSFGVVMSKRGFGLNKCCIIYGLGFIWFFQKRVYDVFVDIRRFLPFCSFCSSENLEDWLSYMSKYTT